MQQLFISYSHDDKSIVERLARDLQDAGLNVWIDFRRIKGGERWFDAIIEAISNCDIFLVSLSRNSINSEWVRREIFTARAQKKYVIPVMLENCFNLLDQHEETEWLRDIQIVSLFADTYEEAFPLVLESLPDSGRLLADEDTDPKDIPNPFKGLEAFQQTDSHLFFGREILVERMLQRLRPSGLHEPGTRFLAVVGASGSGKSSLVRAGLIPAIRAGQVTGSALWPIAMFIPGPRPTEALATRLLPLMGGNRMIPEVVSTLGGGKETLHQLAEGILGDAPLTARLVLVVDQFEEVFTRASAIEAEHFLSLLQTAVTIEAGRTLIIITLRADFFDRLSAYPALAELFEQKNMIIATEMSPEGLRRSIEGPAAAVGLVYDEGLSDIILDDVRQQPGALPLLQYALTKLYERRDGRRLTLEAYDEIGGVRRALAQHAEDIFGSLDSIRKDITKRVLLRLVEVSDTGEVTRRSTDRETLTFLGISDDVVKEVVDLLASPYVRLLVTSRAIDTGEDNDTAPVVWIEISHEALIREWERLANWIVSNEEELRYGGELLKAANDWEQSGRTIDYLLMGARLARAQDWLKSADSSALQREFIEASTREGEIRQQEERDRLMRESRLERQSANRLRYIAALLLIAFVVAVGLIVVILDREQQAQLARDAALRSANEAQSLFWLNSAEQVRDTDPEVALALGLYANSVPNPPGESQSFLANLAYEPGLRFRIDANYVELTGIVDDEILVTQCESRFGQPPCLLRRWNLATREQIYSLELAEHDVPSISYLERLVPSTHLSPDSNVVLQAAFVETPLEVSSEGTEISVNVLAWNAKTGEQMPTIAVPRVLQTDERGIVADGDVNILAHAPNQTEILLGACFRYNRYDWINRIFTVNYASGEVLPWNIDYDPYLAGCVFPDSPADSHPISITYNMDGSRVNVIDCEGLTSLDPHAANWTWNTETDSGVCLASSYEVSPDGELLLHVDAELSEIVVSDAASGTVRSRLPLEQDAELGGMTFTPDSEYILVMQSNTVRVWSLDGTAVYSVDDVRLEETEFLPTHKQAVSRGADAGAILWSIDGASRPTPIGSSSNEATDLQISPDEELIVVDFWNAPAQIYERGAGKYMDGPFTDAEQVVPVSRERVLAIDDGDIAVYDVAPANPVRFLTMPGQIVGRAPSGDAFLLERLNDAKYNPKFSSPVLYDPMTGHWGSEFYNDSIALTVDLDQGEFPLQTAVLSPDATQILSATFGHALVLIDTATGDEIKRFEGHEYPVSAVALSPDGMVAVSGDVSGELIVWNVESGTELRHLDSVAGIVLTLAFGPDGTRVYGGGLGTRNVFVRDVETGNAIDSLTTGDVVTSVFMMRDGERLLAGTLGGVVVLWDSRTGERLEEYDTEVGTAISSLSASSDGKLMSVTTVLTGGMFLILDDNELALSDMDASGMGDAWRIQIVEDDRVDSGQLIIVAYGGGFDVFTFRPEESYAEHVYAGEQRLPLDYSPTKHQVLSLELEDGSLFMEEVPEAFVDSMSDVVSEYSGYTTNGHLFADVTAAAFSPNGERLVTAGEDMQAFAWDAATGDFIGGVGKYDRPILGVEFSPDGTTIAANDGQISLWDAESLSRSGTLDPPEDDSFTAMAFSPESQILASGTQDGMLVLWDTESQVRIQEINASRESIGVVAFRDDGAWIASGSDDNTVRVWQIESGSLVRELVGHEADVVALAFVPQDKLLVSGASDGDIFFWDLSTGQAIRRMADAHPESVEHIWFRIGTIASSSRNSYAEWQNHKLSDLIGWVCQNRYIDPLADEEVRNRYRLTLGTGLVC